MAQPRRVMRRVLLLAALIAVLAGCGAKEEPSVSASGGSSGGGASAKRATLNGCLELWANDGHAHVGSTAVREVAAHSTVYAKVEIRDNLCHVAYATKALTNFGTYVQRDTSYGPFALDRSDLPKSEVREIVRTANATAQSDGTLKPGPPPS
jgi:hypothetical protein